MRSYCFPCLAFLVTGVLACQKEHKHVFHAHRALSKRQETVFPPVLTEQEAALIGSIDNATIEDW